MSWPSEPVMAAVWPSWRCPRSTRAPPRSYTSPPCTRAPGSPAGSPPTGTCWPVWSAGRRCWPPETGTLREADWHQTLGLPWLTQIRKERKSSAKIKNSWCKEIDPVILALLFTSWHSFTFNGYVHELRHTYDLQLFAVFYHQILSHIHQFLLHFCCFKASKLCSAFLTPDCDT